MLRKIRRAALFGAAAFAVAGTAYSQNEQFIPMNGYWVGPYAAGGSGIFGGLIDYMNMINARDGGINGVKLTYEKCETEYNNARGVECYERTKKRGPTGASLVHPLSTGITYSLIDKGTEDHVPIVSIGYGRTDASDGRVFPWIFPLITNYWSQNTAKIKFIGMKEGGMDKLKGKKIVNIYHDSAYGKETIPVLDAQAKKYGFEVSHIPVAHPGNEQQAQWLQIRQIKPDWVILRGWGVMNPTALKAAAKIGFPRNHIVGVWWSGAEEDVIPAGDAAKGYIAAAFNVSGSNYPVVKEIEKFVYAKGKGEMDGQRDREVRVRQGQRRDGRPFARRQHLLQPRRGVRHHLHRGDPHGPGEIRQGQADDRRPDPLGPRESQHRRQEAEAARRDRLYAGPKGVVHGS